MRPPREPASLKGIEALSALDDPVRRRLYEHVVAAAGGATREEAATAVGIGRSLAAYHLDKLAAEGLLSVRRERRTGRSGPGAGRPAKVYSRAEREVSVSVPPRDYALLARLLAEAAACDSTGTTRAALEQAAARVGREMAGEARSSPPRKERERLLELLRERGYEPAVDEDTTIRLLNCPFHAAACEHPEVVCDMNAALLRGLLDGLGQAGMEAILDPREGRCCVAITTERRAA